MALRGVVVVAHSGGPTSVINASLEGVVEECRPHPEITGLYGAIHGIEGVLQERFIDLFEEDEGIWPAIRSTPSSVLGSSRRAVTDSDLGRILEVFRAHNVRYFFYTGGNGSMDTAHRVDTAARLGGWEMRVIGIPKTIDNDLVETDHTPGYPSTARFFACAVRDVGADNRALPSPITFVEVLGRNTGWVVAATSLARREADDAPHLIYCPERRLPVDRLLADVEGVYRRLGRAVIAVCEGQLDETGNPFGADARASSRQPLAMNLGHTLARIVTERLGISARSEKPGLFGRSSAAFISTVDRAESRMCGAAAVRAAAEGMSGKMVTLVREPGQVYAVHTSLAELTMVANRERPFPAGWMNQEGNDVLPEFREYAAPLIGEIVPHARLRGVLVQRRIADVE